ncbi:MAG TPA: hypothetical protein P5136_00250 [Methanofastidiosum sp.]|nr:hypothetical protein [Methanofastidiosum sp.]
MLGRVIPNTTVLNNIKDMAKLSDETNKKNHELNELQYKMLLEKKDEVFISLSDFLMLIDKNNIKLSDILQSCKHFSEIDSSKFSYIDVYPIIEDDKIILSTSEQPTYKGDKIRLITMRLTK